MNQIMDELGKEGAIFIGYNVARGDAMGTLKTVPKDQKLETPVAENLMSGLAIGMSFEGYTPVLYFERHDFMLVAADAIGNHIDKIERILNELEIDIKETPINYLILFCSTIIFAWILTGIITLLAALSFGELSSMMPTAGGQYNFISRIYGRVTGFVYGWSVFSVIWRWVRKSVPSISLYS
jgi:hypothetical protein